MSDADEAEYEVTVFLWQKVTADCLEAARRKVMDPLRALYGDAPNIGVTDIHVRRVPEPPGTAARIRALMKLYPVNPIDQLGAD